jgi:hypothetical protein
MFVNVKHQKWRNSNIGWFSFFSSTCASSREGPMCPTCSKWLSEQQPAGRQQLCSLPERNTASLFVMVDRGIQLEIQVFWDVTPYLLVNYSWPPSCRISWHWEIVESPATQPWEPQISFWEVIGYLPEGGAVLAETCCGHLVNNTNIILYITAFSWKTTCIIAQIFKFHF